MALSHRERALAGKTIGSKPLFNSYCSSVADEVNRLIRGAPGLLIHVAQLRDSAQSIGANISEGFGRREGLALGRGVAALALAADLNTVAPLPWMR